MRKGCKLTFINQDQTQVVPGRVFLIDLAKRRRQIEPAQKQTYRDGLATTRTAIHDLKPDERLTLIILIRTDARRLAADDAQLHMLDLQADEQEIDAPDNHIFQMVLALAVLELDVQAVLDADVHLDAAVRLGRDPVGVHPDVLLAHHVRHPPRHRAADEVAQLAVDPVVGLVLLLHVLEVEPVRLRVLEVARRGQLGVEGEEFVVRAPVEEHFWGLAGSAKRGFGALMGLARW